MEAWSTQGKIRSLNKLSNDIAALHEGSKIVVHCHGVFDLLHVGHIKHLEAARKLGDVLVVTITPDRFVNKGPHRPAFPEQLRAEALASLACVDYVGINEWPTAVETIKLIKPNLYVKGMIREEGKRDHTNAISDEEAAVHSVGGKLHLTDEETFSASTLINRFMDVFTPKTKAFLERFCAKHTPQEIVGHLQSIRSRKVLVIGEAIIDEYQFCSVLGKSSKEPVLAALHNRSEQYAGGALAVANHVSHFCDEVTLLSGLGALDSYEEFIHSKLNRNIRPNFLELPNAPTIVKRRFLEEYLAAKLFEVYIMQNEQLTAELEEQFLRKLEELLPEHDVVIVADYGHGLLTNRAVHLICARAKFLAVNTQVNAGNRGFNLISKYPRADFVSLGEPEVRLDARKMTGDMAAIMRTAATRMGSKYFLVTCGSAGCLCCDQEQNITEVPAFAIRVVDRVGAGDAVLSVTSLCAALGIPPEMLGFIANVVGAEACRIMGHRFSIDPTSVFRHVTSLMK